MYGACGAQEPSVRLWERLRQAQMPQVNRGLCHGLESTALRIGGPFLRRPNISPEVSVKEGHRNETNLTLANDVDALLHLRLPPSSVFYHRQDSVTFESGVI